MKQKNIRQINKKNIVIYTGSFCIHKYSFAIMRKKNKIKNKNKGDKKLTY
jgi:hypothetical protein